MGVTIKDIAEKAGVSIATVSHAINKTRYVSPELIKKIEAVMEETGYKKKIENKESKMLIGRQSVIAFVIPNISNRLYSSLASSLSKILEKGGYTLALYATNDDVKLERRILLGLITDKSIGGIILSPISSHSSNYEKLFKSKIPFICLNRGFDDCRATFVSTQYDTGIYVAVTQLINRGHHTTALVIETNSLQSHSRECIEGYKKAFHDNGIKFSDSVILQVDSTDDEFEEKFLDMYDTCLPTAVIATSNSLTISLIQILKKNKISYPRDISFIGVGDESWSAFASPQLAVLNQDAEKMAQLAFSHLHSMMQGLPEKPVRLNVPLTLNIGKSTSIISCGPFGEKATIPSEITFSEEECEELKNGAFRIGISYSYSGSSCAYLAEIYTRETLEKFGVSVIAVTDAHLKPALQVSQLDAIYTQKPDLILVSPCNDSMVAEKLKKLSKRTKIAFLGDVPKIFSKNNYYTCICVNEVENGMHLADLIGRYYSSYNSVKCGFLTQAEPGYGSHLRDLSAYQTLSEKYSNIKIISKMCFSEDNAYETCKKMFIGHPEIKALYVSWTGSTADIVKALQHLGRTDVDVFTSRLDVEISKYIPSNDFMKGTSTQQPYSQGVAAAKAVAKALLGHTEYRYVVVRSCSLTNEDLETLILRAQSKNVHSMISESPFIQNQTKEKSI